MKIAISDALAILRQFHEAKTEHKVKDIVDFRTHHPSLSNTMVSFRFRQIPYAILLDGNAEDDAGYILSEIAKVMPGDEYEVRLSPLADIMTYGLPYKQKDVYLAKSINNKQRLDLRLAEDYPEYSRSSWQKFIRAGYVSVNGDTVTVPKTDVEVTDSVAIALPAKNDYSTDEIPIIYQDDNVVVIDKPAGMLTHSKGELNDEFTVAEFFRKLTNNASQTNRPGIVHRLDRDTSGVLIGAKNDVAAEKLKKQFAQRTVAKTYIAILQGVPKMLEARVDVPIGRNPVAPGSFRVDANGKPAITDYKVLSTDGQMSLVELRPKTGRTHQLRVHMKFLGAPIVGDRLYGQPAERLYLHARSLEITLPGGERKTFSSPLPLEFTDKLKNDVG